MSEYTHEPSSNRFHLDDAQFAAFGHELYVQRTKDDVLDAFSAFDFPDDMIKLVYHRPKTVAKREALFRNRARLAEHKARGIAHGEHIEQSTVEEIDSIADTALLSAKTEQEAYLHNIVMARLDEPHLTPAQQTAAKKNLMAMRYAECDVPLEDLTFDSWAQFIDSQLGGEPLDFTSETDRALYWDYRKKKEADEAQPQPSKALVRYVITESISPASSEDQSKV